MIEVKVSVLLDASPALVGLVETLKGSIASAPCCEASAPEQAAPATAPATAAPEQAAPATAPATAAPEQAAPAPEQAAPAKPRSAKPKKASESAGHAPAAIPDAAPTPEQPTTGIKTPEEAVAAATGKVDPLPFGDDGRKIDLLTLRRKANALCAMSMDNKDKVFAVLSQMGVTSLPQLKPEQYDECYDLLSQIA